MGKSIMDERVTFRDDVHVISLILGPDGSRNVYTIPRHAAQYDCFAVNRAVMTSMVDSMPVRENRPFDDGWEGY